MNTILIPIIITIVAAIITFITFSREKPSQFGLPVISCIAGICALGVIITTWTTYLLLYVFK